jgi:hypothetical protein
MHVNDRTRLSFVAGACLAAATLVGCNRSDTANDTRGTAGTAGTSDRQEAVNLTGCVQRGSGMLTDAFVLTEVNGTQGTTAGVSTAPETSGSAANNPNTTANRPAGSPAGTPGSVGTAGAASGDIVGREQHAAATKTYRLDGDDQQLRDLVGKQVRVNGHVTDRGDLGRPDHPDTTAGGNVDRDISTKDLARVKVDSIEKVADACGTPSAAPSAPQPPPAPQPPAGRQ